MNNFWKHLSFVIDLISFVAFFAVFFGSIFFEYIRGNLYYLLNELSSSYLGWAVGLYLIYIFGSSILKVSKYIMKKLNS
tara:strand:+ start:248 stop:484 length:237 start_codon:yes stop_codon:yes gene_type:complete